ncbi:hypothetical protein GCM10011583_59590 [Streptomyces camponoticapitis]|uniref:Uncharacterized protein n=1 Tax=Streptomyces camponoticapitis TaxID=1616125 RepID=A0ABQ2EPR1_9ACTN|nr:hypothetical protein GCM10011583_59590 [Streptomyces camponoticapitis]
MPAESSASAAAGVAGLLVREMGVRVAAPAEPAPEMSALPAAVETAAVATEARSRARRLVVTGV